MGAATVDAGAKPPRSAEHHDHSPSVRLAPLHERLLRVALIPAEEAAREWAELRREVDVVGIADRRARKLLPLVWHHLTDLGIDDAVLVDLEAIVSSTRAANEERFGLLGAALGILEQAGIPSLVLKGVPLALLYYPDPGVRPMSDVDILVPAEDAPEAVRALARAGWQTHKPLPRDFVARVAETDFLRSEGGPRLDLHWRLVPWVARDGSNGDARLWSAAIPATVGGRTTLAPAAEDLLLHVVLHAFKSGWSEVPRWVGDVAAVVGPAGGAPDWDAFERRVVSAELAVPVTNALRYTADTFSVPVPEHVLATLDAVRPTRRVLHKYRIALRPKTQERHWFLGQAGSLRTKWARTSINLTRRGAMRVLPSHLRGHLHVDRLLLAPAVVVGRRARRRVGHH